MQYEDGSISLVKAFFAKKWVRLGLVIDVVAILVLIGVLIWQATKVSTITFNIAPVDATISVNGKTGFTNGTYSITPGTYEIKISHDNLESKTFTIDIAPRHAVTLSAFLSDADQTFGFYELKENYASFLKLAEIASADNNTTNDYDTSAEDFIETFQNNYSIWQKKLPVHFTDYQETETGRKLVKDITIKTNYDEECKKTLCIKALMAFTDDKEFVNQMLKDQGFDLDHYEVVYEIF